MKKYIDLLTFKIFSEIYKFQKIRHKKRMQKLRKKVMSKNGVQNAIIAGASFCVENKNDTIKHQEKIEKIFEKYLHEPKKLLAFIESKNTSIYIVRFANKFLKIINEKEGFIYPKKGFSALYLNLILNKKIDYKTDEMFILNGTDINIYDFLYQFYNWYCFKMKLSGYERETQEKFKQIFEICSTSKIDKLSYEEIIGLKNAIKRDIEAIDFVKKMTQKHSMQKKNLDKIKQGQTICV